MGKYALLITGTFFEGQHSVSVEASDVESFLAGISAACGLEGVSVSVQYEDPDFNEWCEVDDLDDLETDGQVSIRLKAPQGTVLNMPGTAPAPAAAGGDVAGASVKATTKSAGKTTLPNPLQETSEMEIEML